VGCDFGVRPRYGIIADVTFTEYLKSHRALGYGELPSFGLLIKPPVLYYLFEDENSARQCFTIFKGWVDHSNDGDAVSLTFIEYDDGAYGLVTAPDLIRLIDRTLPPTLQKEYEPLAFIPSKILEVPMQSDSYKWFKAKATNLPFVVAAVAPKSGIQMDLAFRKREIAFLRAAEVGEDHPSYIHVRAQIFGPGGIQATKPTFATSR